ncbi:MAG: hypothetical protein WA162_06685 [Thermodesulfobacteriota bacterium]
MKLIILIIVIYIAYRLISALLTGKAQSTAFDAKKNTVRDGEDTVFDAICGSYVVKSAAITEKKGGSLFYFCGAECREKFLKS